MSAHFVLGVLQVEHEGPVLVLVAAVGVKTEVEHFLLDGDGQPRHLVLSLLQIVAVVHPGGGGKKTRTFCLPFEKRW